MGDERYPRNTDPQGDYYGRNGQPDYSRDYGSGRDYTSTSAREYEAAGELGGNRERGGNDRGGYGQRDYGNQRYGQREAQGRGRDYGSRSYGADAGQQGGGRDGQSSQGQGYRGSYAHDGHRFEDVGRYRDYENDDRRGSRDEGRDYGRAQGDYARRASASGRQQDDRNERGFLARAGDEVRSWFGDEDAERRRDRDAGQDPGSYGQRHGVHRDSDYHSWRNNQIAAFDRDYEEYRQENQSRFHAEFTAWRNERQGQRDSLSRVNEHMDVVGSDGEHVGTVDKVRGDRILLTKSDRDAGGRHHSIPSRWVQSVEGKVTLRKTAQEAKDHWRDEEQNQAMFGDRSDERTSQTSSMSSATSGNQAGRPGSAGYATGDATSSASGGTQVRGFSES